MLVSGLLSILVASAVSHGVHEQTRTGPAVDHRRSDGAQITGLFRLPVSHRRGGSRARRGVLEQWFRRALHRRYSQHRFRRRSPRISAMQVHFLVRLQERTAYPVQGWR